MHNIIGIINLKCANAFLNDFYMTILKILDPISMEFTDTIMNKF